MSTRLRIQSNLFRTICYFFGNRISFLAGNANDAMVSFLSPLLPVAQALSIPVLDFDRYKESRDSKETADVTIP